MSNLRTRAADAALYPQNPETIRRVISVEILLNNTTGKFTFPNNNELNGKRIIGISVPDNSAGNMKSISNVAVATNACVAATYLEIRRDSDNIIYQVPLKFYQETSGDREVRPINIKGFNPQTSGIVIVDTSTYTSGSTSMVIVIEYTDI